MRKVLYILLVMLISLPSKAETASVTVPASTSYTFRDLDISEYIRSIASDRGLVHIGWTTSEITDGNLPATYYGVHAEVTPATNTTYYAFFAQPSASGTRVVRKLTTTPSDNDTVMLVINQSTAYYVVPNGNGLGGVLNDIALTSITSNVSDNLYTASDPTPYTFRYEQLTADTFRLRAAYKSAPEYYLYARTANYVGVGVNLTDAKYKFVMKGGHPYSKFAGKNIYLVLDSYEPYWRPAISGASSTMFFRAERYTGFVTDIVNPCPHCFRYTP